MPMSFLQDVKRVAEKATGLRRPPDPQTLLRDRKPVSYRFKDDGLIPNHPRWPLLIYKSAVRLPDSLDPAAIFEELFQGNGWGDSWRDGIYHHVHYHSHTHEVLGIARGSAKVKFGGSKGRLGEPIDAQSVISLPMANRRCVLLKFERSPDDRFLRRLDASAKKWVIVTDLDGEPVFVLDSDHFLRDTLFDRLQSDPTAYLHRPIVVRDMRTRLGDVIGRMKVAPQRPSDDVIDNDLILVWGAQRRIITGADLLGRLLRDIVTLEGDKSASASK
jgi:uncharacterized protein YjlB